MQLRLSYSPTPENGPRFAADITTSARQVSGVHLDYTEASIEQVDQIIDGFRRDGVLSEQVGETLFGFGCYVGEVLVRRAGGRWVPAAGTPMAAFGTQGIIIQLGPDRFCDPIAKAFKRMENGPEDSLRHFFAVFAADGDPALDDTPSDASPKEHRNWWQRK